jgi:hypothetical protein
VVVLLGRAAGRPCRRGRAAARRRGKHRYARRVLYSPTGFTLTPLWAAQTGRAVGRDAAPHLQAFLASRVALFRATVAEVGRACALHAGADSVMRLEGEHSL